MSEFVTVTKGEISTRLTLNNMGTRGEGVVSIYLNEEQIKKLIRQLEDTL